MRHTPLLRAILAIAFVVTLTACGRGDDEAETVAEATTAPATATTAPAIATAAPAATNTPEPTAAAVTAAPTDTPIAAPTDAPTDTPAASEQTGQTAGATFSTVEQAASINSYRMNVSMTNQRGGDAQPDTAVIQGEFVKEPPAQHLTSMFRESSGHETTVETIVVDGTTYVKSGDQWVQTTDAMPFNLAEVTLITPQSFADSAGNFTVVGSEEVNGRQTVHYQGNKDSIQRGGTESDAFDPQALTAAEVHLWVDAAENFIVRMQLTAEASDGQGMTQTMQLAHEYTDFNGDIAITAPEGATALVPPAPAEGSFTALLGFELSLPEDATVQFFGGGRTAAITMQVPMEEVATHLKEQMEGAGYTQVSSVNTSATEIAQTYQKDAKTIVATLFVTGSGGTGINLAGG